MSCREMQDLMHGYLDGELDRLTSSRVEQHVRGCAACDREYGVQQALSSALSGRALYRYAPAHLEGQVRAAVRAAGDERSRSGVVPWHWLTATGVLALIAIVIAAAMFVHSRSSDSNSLAREIVSAHVRSLMASHLTDVASSDQHNVKPWFEGQLDFSPPVTDLAKRGFLLVGGRLEYVGNRPVAALVYQRRRHVINLFVWPSADDSSNGTKMSLRQGYNLARWGRSGMTYWAVSDLNISELQEFSQAIQDRS